MTPRSPTAWAAELARNSEPQTTPEKAAFAAPILGFTERWATSMEVLLLDGMTPDAAWFERWAKTLAIHDGVNDLSPMGAMLAVRLLGIHWLHGEALTEWYNLKHAGTITEVKAAHDSTDAGDVRLPTRYLERPS